MNRNAILLASAILTVVFCLGTVACSTTPREQAAEKVTHTLEAGDTLSTLARHYYGDTAKWVLIAQANPTKDPLGLRAGMVLVIPADPDADPAVSHDGANR